MKCKWNDFENGDWVDLKLEMDESEMQLKLRKINSAHGFTPKSVLEEKKLILIFFVEILIQLCFYHDFSVISGMLTIRATTIWQF